MRVSKYVKKNMALLLIMLALSPVTATATEQECRDVLHKCDAALKAQEELNTSLNAIIKDQDKVIDLQKSQLNEMSIWKPIAIGGLVVIGVETLVLILRK